MINQSKSYMLTHTCAPDSVCEDGIRGGESEDDLDVDGLTTTLLFHGCRFQIFKGFYLESKHICKSEFYLASVTYFIRKWNFTSFLVLFTTFTPLQAPEETAAAKCPGETRLSGSARKRPTATSGVS
jgi:hypothetical protein